MSDILRVKHWAGPQHKTGRLGASELHRPGRPGLPARSQHPGKETHEGARRAERELRWLYRMAATGGGLQMDRQHEQELAE